MPADVAGQGWRIMQPVPNYDSGSDGPKATDELLTDDGGRAWRPVSLSSEQGQRNIRLLLADVDGTLVTQDKVLTAAAKAAARELLHAGIALAVTSGRPPRGMSI